MIQIDMEYPDCCDGCDLIVAFPKKDSSGSWWEYYCPCLAKKITVNRFTSKMPDCPLREVKE